jgi:hypothetical protein
MRVIPEPHDLRTSDAEREAVADVLREHAAAGRLDADELEERLGAAYGAQLRADLVPLVADLPVAAPAPAPAPAARPRRPRPQVPPLVMVSIMLIAIWALSGMGYFWPIWPIGAMALSALAGGGCARGRQHLRHSHDLTR